MSNRIIRNLPDSKYKAVVGNTLAGGSNPFGTESEITDQVTESEIVNGLNVGINNTNVDAAYIATDGIYRMPTKTEGDELINNCTWTWSTQNGVNGYTVEGNGNSIFIPASGYRNGASLLNDGTEGYLWTDTFIDEWTFMVMFSSSQHYTNGSTSRCYGRTIRPVSSIEGVDLGLPSGLKWASVNIGATLPEDYGDYFAWAETETKESFTSENYICPSGSEGTELDPVTHVTKYSLVNILHKNNPNIHTSPEKEARWDYKEGIKRFQVQAAVSGYAILDKLTSPCVIMINGSTMGYVNPAAFIFWRSGTPYSIGKVTAKHNGEARTLGISLAGIYGQGVDIAVIPLTDTEYTGTLSIGSYSGAAVIANEGVLEKIANKTNDINSSSTFDQYPNAKAVYDAIKLKTKNFTGSNFSGNIKIAFVPFNSDVILSVERVNGGFGEGIIHIHTNDTTIEKVICDDSFDANSTYFYLTTSGVVVCYNADGEPYNLTVNIMHDSSNACVLEPTSTLGNLITISLTKLEGKQDALGFTPENSANKKTSLAENSDTYYPTQKAVKTALDSKVTGAASSTVGYIAVADDTSGKSIKYVPVTVDDSGNVVISGNATINGTLTTINSETLQVKDKNIEIAKVDTPTDDTADGGGITLLGATNKTITWVKSKLSWVFNQAVEIAGNLNVIGIIKTNGSQISTSDLSDGSNLVKNTASSTDNAIARFDGDTGKLVQNSGAYIDDSGKVGIGITGPSEKLHVIGNTLASGDSASATKTIGGKVRMAYDSATDTLKFNFL